MVHSPLMIERYHLVLAAQAIVVGLLATALDRWAPERLRNRVVAAAGVAAVFLGAWGNPRVLPWFVPACLLVIPADRPGRSHPLGRWTLAMAVASLAGVWSAVPDTEAPLAAGCVLAPLALGRGVGNRRLGNRHVGPVASGALVISILGAAWVGSAGWGAALASCAAAGMTVVAPCVVGFVTKPIGKGPVRWLLLGHLPVALLLPRLVAFRSVVVAIVIDLIALACLVVIAMLVRPVDSRFGVSEQ